MQASSCCDIPLCRCMCQLTKEEGGLLECSMTWICEKAGLLVIGFGNKCSCCPF